MSRTVIVLLVVTVSIVASIGIGVAIFASQAKSMDADSKAYVDSSVQAIVFSWSKEELLKRSSPQSLAIINKDSTNTDQLFRKLATLGTLQQYRGSEGQAMVFFNFPMGKNVSAKYVAHATFEHGVADVQIQLTQTAGEWQIMSFHVSSPIFLKNEELSH